MATVADLLRDAARYVRAGHTKGAIEDFDGNVCAYGALNKAAYGFAKVPYGFRGAVGAFDLHQQAATALRVELKLYNIDGIVDWNDDPYITAVEVAETMEKLAAQIEERGRT